MGGRDQAHVDLDRRGAPQPLELARLQHAQQLGLHLERQLADLVEEERRAVRDLEAPDLARQGPGEGALLAAEQLALHEPGRQRGAVDLDHQVAPARAEPVDGLGDELLAGAGLAAHEHRGVRGRDLLHQAQDLLDGGALPGDLAVRVDDLDLGLEVVALGLEPVLQSLDLGVRLPQGLLALPSLRDVAEDTVRLDRRVRWRRAWRRGPGDESTSPHGPDAGSDTRWRAAPASRRATAGARPTRAGGRQGADARSRTPRARRPPPVPGEHRRGRETGRR